MPEDKPLVADITLIGQGVPEETVDRALAVRTVAMFMANPKVPMSADYIAEKMNCSVHRVMHVLRSPEYAEMLRTDILQWSLSSLSRSMPSLQNIVDDENSKPMEKIAATRAMATVYETASRVIPTHREEKARAQFEALMDSINVVTVIEKEADERSEISD